MKSMTKNNLSLQEFRDAVFMLLKEEYVSNTVANVIEQAECDSDMLNDLYEEGLNVQNAVNALIDEYKYFNGLDRR